MIFKFATMLKNSAKMKNGYMTIKKRGKIIMKENSLICKSSGHLEKKSKWIISR